MKTIKLFSKVKWLVVTCLMLLTISPQMWGATFTPAQIAASGGTTTNNIKVSTSLSAGTAKKCSTQSSVAAISLSNSSDGNYNSNYIEIQATSGTITSLSLQARGNSDGNTGAMVIVFWSGDAQATYSSYSISFNYLDRAGTYCDDAGYVEISVPSNTKTVRLYKKIYVKDGAISSASGKATVQASGTYNIFGISALSSTSCMAADLTAANITSNGDQIVGTGITFSKVGSPASGDTWYWQTSSTGTDKTYNASSNYITATTAGSYTVYLRAYNSGSDCWGTAISKTNTIFCSNVYNGENVAKGSTTASGWTIYSSSSMAKTSGSSNGYSYWYQASSGSGDYVQFDGSASLVSGDKIIIRWTHTNGSDKTLSLTINGSSASLTSGSTASNSVLTEAVYNVTSTTEVTSIKLNSTGSKGCIIYQVAIVKADCGGGGEEKDYTVTAATSTGDNTYGTVSAGASSLDERETTRITATPATGYQVTNWAVSDGDNGASISPNGASNATYTTLTMGTANATVTATFGPKSYTVTLDNQSATSAGTENVTTTYNSNTNLTSAITCPTKTSKVFAGYFTATNGGGVQLIDPAGNWIASAGGNNAYTDGSKNWKYDNNLTLYACWMEYCQGMDMEAYVNDNLSSGSTSKTFTILGTNKFLYNLGGNTEFDNSTDDKYDGLKIKRSGDYLQFLVQANCTLSVTWGYVKTTKPKYSINGGAETEFSITKQSDNQTVNLGAQSYDRFVKIKAMDSDAAVLKKVTITSGGGDVAPVISGITGGNASASVNQKCTLTVSMSAGTNLSYQWKESSDNSNWSDVSSGGTSATYVATAPASATSHYYKCYVSNSAGNATSGVATITVPSYTMTYNANGGDDGSVPAASETCAKGATYTVLGNSNSLSKTGYSALAYWNTADNGGGTDYAIGSGTFTASANVTLYAKWSQSITVNANTSHGGSTSGAITILYNATGPASFTAATGTTGYSLLGYYSAATDGVKILNADGSFAGSNVSVSEDAYISSGKWVHSSATTLYPQYELLTYDLTATATVSASSSMAGVSERTGAISGATITNGSLEDVPYGTVPSVSNNIFTVGSTTVTAPATVEGTEEECWECVYVFDHWENIPNTVSADVSNIHAVYKTRYSLSYNLQSGSWISGDGEPSTYIYGTGVTLPTSSTVSRDGYRLDGWKEGNEGETVTAVATTDYGDMTYHAQWTAVYAVSKSTPSNGDFTISPTTAAAGATISLSATPSVGYALSAWTITKTSDGTDVTASVSLSGTTNATFTMPAYAVTVDATFAVQQFTLSYNNGGASSGSVPSSPAAGSYDSGTEITVPGNTGSLVKGTDVFRGWTDGTTFYLASQKLTITSDVTLTAVWDGGTSCETLVSGTKNTTTNETIDATIGTIGNTNTAADNSSVKLTGNSSYFTLTAKTGYTPIVAGDKLTVTMYNKDNGAKTLGYRLHASDAEDTYTTSVDSKSTKNVEHILLAADIEDNGTVKIFRSSSSDHYEAILLERCTKSNFTVSFNMKSHGDAVSSIVGVPTGKKIVAPPAPTETGYTFGGWYRDNSCSNVWNWASSTVTQDTTLYAKWTPNQYAINYYDQGGSAFSGEHSATPPTTHTYGTATTLKSATKSCYTFGGWYTNSSCTGSAVNTLSATGYTADINLYAKWTLTLDVTTEPTTPVAATVGSASSISMAATGASSYQWQICDDDEGTNATNITGLDTEYSNYTTNTLSFTPASAGTYYLRCKITDACSNNDYTQVVTVNASEAYDVEKGSYTNGSITTISPTSAGAGTSISISATPDDNYVFKNWTIHKKGDASTTVTPSSSTSSSTTFSMPAYDVTVNATFVATHTLTVSVSGGVGGTVSPTSTTVGETLTQSITATPGTGYNFTSWEVSGTGARLSSTTTNPTTFTMGTANATVTATFGAKTYSITLDANGGSSGSANVTMTYKSASHTSITAPTLTGYSLVGWYTGEGGTGTMVMNASGTLQASVTGYTDGSGNWTKDATCTLYAKWAANYPEGYLYITDVKSTPEAKAGYTITMGKNSANYNGTLGSTLQTNRAGYEYWADATGSSGNITLSFSDALPASATAGGMIIDVWWGADSNNRTTSIALNGGSAELLDAANTSTSDRDIVKKATYATELKSLSSITLSCNGGHTVWFRIGIKERPGYLLTYDDGDGSGAPSASYQPNKTITLSNTEPTYAGHVFLGWQVNGSGTVYAAGASFSMPAEAVTLVAKWEAYCYEATITKSSSSYSLSQGETKDITSDATVTSGGAVKIVNNYAGSKDFSFSDNGVAPGTSAGYVELVLPSGSALGVGSIIRIKGAGTESEAGLLLIDDEGNTIASQTNNGAIDFSYTVTAESTLKYKNHIRIARAKASSKNHFKSVTVRGCASCAPYTPTLTYSRTTIWMDDANKTASPTVNKDGSSGSVTYVSSNTDVATVNESTGIVTAVARGTATITATVAADGTHCDKSATCDITIKDIGCGNNTMAKATRSGTSASYSGVAGGSALVSTLDGSSYKLKSGGYVGVQLPSTLSFQEGDIVRIDLTIGDWWDGASADALPVVVYADNTGTNEIYRTNNYTSLTAQVVEFEVTSSMLTALASKQVTVYRKSSTETQNHVVNSVEVKRYTCPDSKEFLPTGDNGNWNATDNWIGEAGREASLPTSSDRVVISKPVTVNVTTAAAKDILINQYSGATGKVTINSDAVLQVEGTIQKTTTGSTRVATAVGDLIIDCDKDHQGALIFENPSGDKQAQGTVNFYTRSYRGGTGNKLQWQYVGYPFASGTDEDYDGYYINKYSESQGKWIVMRDQGDRTINAWEGLAISGDDEGGAQLQGTFAPTTNTNVSLTYGNAAGENLIGNSWTAPIQLENLAVSDFNGAEATIYIFNTGRYNDVDGKADAGTSGHTAGQWLAIPIEGANWSEWAGMKVIPAFQAFEVITSSATTLSLDYSKVVRSATNTMNAELHAPARRGIKAAEVDGYRIRVADSLTQTDMYLFEDITFTTDFDNGWEGYYMACDGRSAQLYAQTALGKMAVAALPDLEGTLLGFKPGKSSEYTFSFGTNAGVYYLNDIKTQTSTLIQEGYEYTFTWEDGDDTNRFIISATPFAKTTPTGVDKVQGDKVQSDKVRKVLIDDHLYIIRAGKVFDATGGLVK